MSPTRMRSLAPSTRPGDKALKLASAAAVLTNVRRVWGVENAAAEQKGPGAFMTLLGQVPRRRSKGNRRAKPPRADRRLGRAPPSKAPDLRLHPETAPLISKPRVTRTELPWARECASFQDAALSAAVSGEPLSTAARCYRAPCGKSARARSWRPGR